LTQEFIEAKSEGGEADKALLQATHRTLKKVSQDVESLNFNTAVAALMEYVNDLYKLKASRMAGDDWKTAITYLVQMVAPFAPHLADELWHQLGHEGSVHVALWPMWDEAYLQSDTVKIVIQVNGKLRGEINVAVDSPEEEVKAAALAQENVQQFVGEKEPKRVIYVPGRLVNIVV
jgi:leucyl-tRNA synthetase